MAWTQRQQSMLKAMGLRTWQPLGGLAAGITHDAEGVDTRVDPAGGAVTHTAQTTRAITPGAAPVAPAAPVALRAGPVPQASPSVFEQISWAELPAVTAACQACGLCQSRQQPVFGLGRPGARWMLVVEAPDAAEEAAGEPGAGPAGTLLDNMLRAVGLMRQADDLAQQVVITSAVKCRPPRDRKPDLSELAACAPLLARQVALVQPQVILAMGRVAIRQVLGSDEPLGRLRGQVHRYGDTPVIATYDAAYLMRQPADKAKAWEDLCLAASLVHSG